MPLPFAKIQKDNYTTTELTKSCNGYIGFSYYYTHVGVKSLCVDW